MKVFIAAYGILALTVFFLFFFLDAGAREADLCVFLAPVNSVCGLVLCVVAFKRRLAWVGVLGLSMMVIWPFFTLALTVQAWGVLRQVAVGTVAAAYTLLGALCFYHVTKDEWGPLRNGQRQ